MSTFTRTINIRSSDLGKNVVLVLIFDESVPYMFQGDIFPTAWKYVHRAHVLEFSDSQ